MVPCFVTLTDLLDAGNPLKHFFCKKITRRTNETTTMLRRPGVEKNGHINRRCPPLRILIIIYAPRVDLPTPDIAHQNVFCVVRYRTNVE